MGLPAGELHMLNHSALLFKLLLLTPHILVYSLIAGFVLSLLGTIFLTFGALISFSSPSHWSPRSELTIYIKYSFLCPRHRHLSYRNRFHYRGE